MTGPILYFIEGNVPTNDEFADALQYMGKGPMFEFVSLSSVDLNAPKMDCSAAYGKVPDEYKDLKPVVAENYTLKTESNNSESHEEN